MNVVGLQRVSLIDYPEHVAASVFLGGCNFDCSYCHNRWMIDATRAPEVVSLQDLLAWLATRTGLLDGVCISGGEPTLHAELGKLISDIRDLGLAVKLDTNGTRPKVLAALLDRDCLDYVAMDVKAPLDQRYDVVAGCSVDTDALQSSMALLRQWGGAFEFRTTVGPQLGSIDLDDIAASLIQTDRWVLQPFVPAEGVALGLNKATFLSARDLATEAQRLQSLVPKTSVRG